jgi:uncharacterized membrane-anchored protein
MRRHFRSFPVLIFVFLLTGCRFYGSPEAVDLARTEFRAMISWSETELKRLDGDRTALETAGSPEAAEVVAELAAGLSGQAEYWTAQSAGLEDNSSFRDVRRALSGMISERQRHEDAYARVVAALGGAAPARTARSQFEPTHYQRIHYRADRRGIRDILQAR